MHSKALLCLVVSIMSMNRKGQNVVSSWSQLLAIRSISITKDTPEMALDFQLSDSEHGKSMGVFLGLDRLWSEPQLTQNVL